MRIKDIDGIGNVRIVMLKGEKGDKGEGAYDDTEIRQLIAESQTETLREIATQTSRLDTYIAEIGSIQATKIVETVLFEAQELEELKDIGDTAELNDYITNFDYIDVYSIFAGTVNIKRFETNRPEFITDKTEFILNAVQTQENDTHTANISNFVFTIENKTVTVTENGSRRLGSSAQGYDEDSGRTAITKIIGVKYKDANATKDPEVIDIRRGTDGKVYQTAGERISAEINKSNESLNGVISQIINKADKQNQYSGFEAGEEAHSYFEGAAVGKKAKTSSGFSGGAQAESQNGAAVGYMAVTSEGFAGGREAKCINNGKPIDAIQLGTGINENEKTFQVYSYPILDENGYIPNERLSTDIARKNDISKLFKFKGTVYNLDTISITSVGDVYNCGASQHIFASDPMRLVIPFEWNSEYYENHIILPKEEEMYVFFINESPAEIEINSVSYSVTLEYRFINPSFGVLKVISDEFESIPKENGEIIFTPTIDVKAGDNIVACELKSNKYSTVSYWDVLSSYIDLSGYATKEELLNKADKENSYGGFEAGNSALSENGASVGFGATSRDGGAVGMGAATGDGFAGGREAMTIDSRGQGIDAIQLGTGINEESNTLQVYDYQLLDGAGNIPSERIPQLNEKSDKTAISKSDETAPSLEMVHNTEMRYGTVSSLNITLPQSLEDDYISSVVFTSGSEAVNLIYPEAVKISGEDCIDGVFIPAPNKRYTLILSYDGEDVSGVVGGHLK